MRCLCISESLQDRCSDVHPSPPLTPDPAPMGVQVTKSTTSSFFGFDSCSCPRPCSFVKGEEEQEEWGSKSRSPQVTHCPSLFDPRVGGEVLSHNRSPRVHEVTRYRSQIGYKEGWEGVPYRSPPTSPRVGVLVDPPAVPEDPSFLSFPCTLTQVLPLFPVVEGPTRVGWTSE